MVLGVFSGPFSEGNCSKQMQETPAQWEHTKQLDPSGNLHLGFGDLVFRLSNPSTTECTTEVTISHN
eukprot:2210822-Pyramimonas_sp.AAC.1